MGVIKYIGRKLADSWSEWKRPFDGYRAEYRRCSEGTPEEVYRKLAAWDATLRATRANYNSY